MMTFFRFLQNWGLAMTGSILLNISLFGLMPGLIQGVPDSPDKLDKIQQVRVVRIKPAHPHVPEKELEKIKPAEPEKKIIGSKTAPSRPQPLNLNLKLDFALNPKLPAAPTDLVMPAIEPLPMDLPALKDRYSMGELDSPLVTLVRIPPLYPVRASRRGIEGSVDVEFLVTKTGHVEQIRIVHAEPENIFDKSVINCVSKWKFKPGTVGGIPVAATARTTIRFKLEN
ncbi:MAG: energy transducer TonB [Proteobacteria bacterium]|nr:energy transducer TonB [Pseudomonadota bacterium]MBU1585225.1 energy transducer TonB [Pseudomonadota bacterium]MBU2454538.1 energy transducer TonB [Pseudomonadota bacterium]